MNEYNDKGERHGPWEVYHDNGNLWYKKNYVNGKEHGLCELYHSNGNPMYKKNYVNGKLHGLCELYHSNGKLDGLLERYNYDSELYIKQYYI